MSWIRDKIWVKRSIFTQLAILGGYLRRLDWCRVPPQPRPFSWPGTPKDQPTVNIEAAASPNFASQTSWGVFKQGQVVGDLHAVWEPSEAGKRPWASFKKCPKHKYWHFFLKPQNFPGASHPFCFLSSKGGPHPPPPLLSRKTLPDPSPLQDGTCRRRASVSGAACRSLGSCSAKCRASARPVPLRVMGRGCGGPVPRLSVAGVVQGFICKRRRHTKSVL